MLILISYDLRVGVAVELMYYVFPVRCLRYRGFALLDNLEIVRK